MNLFSLMRQFTIRLRMLGAIGVVLGLLGARACWACSVSMT